MEKKIHQTNPIHRFEELSEEDIQIFHHFSFETTQEKNHDLFSSENDDASYALALQLSFGGLIEHPQDEQLVLQMMKDDLNAAVGDDVDHIPLEKQKLGQIHSEDDKFYHFYCPYGCGQLYLISKIETPTEGVHCGKMHCGTYIDESKKQVIIPQHATDAEVEKWRSEGRLQTFCGYQFKMVLENGKYTIKQCHNE